MTELEKRLEEMKGQIEDLNQHIEQERELFERLERVRQGWKKDASTKIGR